MYKKIIWIGLLVLSVISSIVFVSGFIISLAITNSIAMTNTTKASTNINADTKAPPVVSLSNSYNILIMGDSLAKATGDEKGLGFANDFINLERLKTTKEVKVKNISVNGDRSTDLLQVVENTTIWQAIENSKIIFISIGGNEIKQFKSNDITIDEIQDIENIYLDNLKATFKLLRNKNKTCTIVFIGLYNPFDKDLTPDKLKLLSTWNYDTQQLISDNANPYLFLPTIFLKTV